MISNLPKPIAICIAAENRGDTEAVAQCFAEAPSDDDDLVFDSRHEVLLCLIL